MEPRVPLSAPDAPCPACDPPDGALGRRMLRGHARLAASHETAPWMRSSPCSEEWIGESSSELSPCSSPPWCSESTGD